MDDYRFQVRLRDEELIRACERALEGSPNKAWTKRNIIKRGLGLTEDGSDDAPQQIDMAAIRRVVEAAVNNALQNAQITVTKEEAEEAVDISDIVGSVLYD